MPKRIECPSVSVYVNDLAKIYGQKKADAIYNDYKKMCDAYATDGNAMFYVCMMHAIKTYTQSLETALRKLGYIYDVVYDSTDGTRETVFDLDRELTRGITTNDGVYDILHGSGLDSTILS